MGSSCFVPPSAPRGRVFGVGILLVAAVVLVYYPVAACDFVSYDDDLYVTANPTVQEGVTLAGIRLAFLGTTAANWHPLTMLSLELDSQLFGHGKPLEHAKAFHLTNLFFHAVSTVLLFLALQYLTGCLWRSAWVAAIFALHPLHVESVAWISERKDVLSGCFWMLTFLAYGWYARSPSRGRMALVALVLALGLMAKPMLVTLPCVCLLLDYWPLRRLQWASPGTDWPGISIGQAIREKLPLFAISAASCVVTVMAQHGQAVRSLTEVPLPIRLQNAALAPVVYLRKMLWPMDLAIFYPIDHHNVPLWQVAGAIAVLVLTTIVVWQFRVRHPYLAVGWLWFLGTLVPVIGLVQVGDQAWADRYTYIPLIGIFIGVAWCLPQLISGWASRKLVLALLGGCTVAFCAAQTRVQISFWRDDVNLWERALAVDKNNAVAHNNLGTYLGEKGRKYGDMGLAQAAFKHFKAATEIDASNSFAQVNLAKSLIVLRGNGLDEAIESLRKAVDADPANVPVRLLLADLRFTRGDLNEAMSDLTEILRRSPDLAEAHMIMGKVCLAEDRLEESAEQFQLALREPPGDKGKAAGLNHYLGFVMIWLQRWPEAVASLRAADELQPGTIAYKCDLGLALYGMGEVVKAQEQYGAATLIQPRWTDQFDAQARKLTANQQPDGFHTRQSLALAQEVCQATGFRNPQFVDTLAAAQARAGRFSEAQETEHKAIGLAREAKQDALAERLRERLAYYEKRQMPP
jgi:tetratricopeptide (TPR) repeat protein